MEKLRYYDGKCGLMLYYSQTSGLLKQDDKALGYGYAGHGTGLNNPDFQAVKSTGPIPRGKWEIGKFFDNPGHLGPIVAALRPIGGQNVFGRGGFFIHGDNSKMNNTHAAIQPIMFSQSCRGTESASTGRGGTGY